MGSGTMTKIDIFSGFLGAGKTTLIKKLIKEAYAGEKVVLIENGIDPNAPVAEEGVYRVRVPRQVDASLEMVMLSNQEIVNRLPLGEYIIRSGYDWAAKDLSDVSVALDLEKQQVMVTVSGWDGVVMMDIVI